MTLDEAINASQISAARGFDSNKVCVASVAFYGDKLVWLSGFGGDWSKNWKEVGPSDRARLETLDFKPTGPKPEEQIEREVIAAITAIHEDEDEFEPMGESDTI